MYMVLDLQGTGMYPAVTELRAGFGTPTKVCARIPLGLYVSLKWRVGSRVLP